MKTPTMETVIRNHLQSTLELYNWNKTAVGQALDLDRRTVYRMIERFKLEPLRPLELAAEFPLLRCDDCGSVSEPGELDQNVIHTHDCPRREPVQ